MSPFPAAVFLAVFSLLIILLIIPPMWWHSRNRNVGASMVIAWMIAMNLIIFINAVIWPDDDLSGRYTGVGLCDIEVKIQVASQVAFPAAFSCVLRALAAVMDTERVTMGKTDDEKRRGFIIDMACCFGFPALQIIFHYIVQTRRYYIWGVSGCVPAVTNSWVTVLLILTPPLLWTLVCSYYAILIIIRLHRYRRSFNTLLANSNTNKSRFLRLFFICLLWVFATIPIQAYIFYQSVSVPLVPYKWSDVHDKEQWHEVELIASDGNVAYDRYIWLSAGFVTFMIFGFGKEALGMYYAGMKTVGLDKVVPKSWKDSMSRQSSAFTGSVNSVSSRAKSLFKRKPTSESSIASKSLHSKSGSVTDASSSKTPNLNISKLEPFDLEKGYSVDSTAKAPPSSLRDLVGTFKSMFRPRRNDAQLDQNFGQEWTVTTKIHSNFSAPVLTHVRTGRDVLVRKEVRQASELAY